MIPFSPIHPLVPTWPSVYKLLKSDNLPRWYPGFHSGPRFHAAPVLVGKTTNPCTCAIPWGKWPTPMYTWPPHLIVLPHPMRQAGEGNSNWGKELPKSPQVIKSTPKFQPRYLDSVANAASAEPQLFPHFVKSTETWGKEEIPWVLALRCFLLLELKPWGKLTQISNCSNIVGDLARELIRTTWECGETRTPLPGSSIVFMATLHKNHSLTTKLSNPATTGQKHPSWTPPSGFLMYCTHRYQYSPDVLHVKHLVWDTALLSQKLLHLFNGLIQFS